MIFGNRNTLAFEIDPVEPSWERRSIYDRGPWAKLKITALGKCLTTVIEKGSSMVRDGVYVPLLPIADWLLKNIRYIAVEESPVLWRCDVDTQKELIAWNNREPPCLLSSDIWEDARYEWYCRHFLLSGAEGCILPDVGLVKSDDRLWLSWSASKPDSEDRTIFCEPPGCEGIPWNAAFEALTSFVDYALTKAKEKGVSPTAACHSLKESLFCDVQTFLKIVAPSTLTSVSEIGIDFAKDSDSSPAMQTMRDLDLNTVSKDLFEGLSRLEKEVEKGENNPERETCRNEVRSGIQLKNPEQSGYEVARWLRDKFSLGNRPLSTAGLWDLCRTFATVDRLSVSETNNDAVIGASSGRKGTVLLLRHKRTAPEWVERMELARSFGHLLLDPYTSKGVLGAASSRAAKGPRRRRSGSFAAELLCPSNGLREIMKFDNTSKPQNFEEIMTTFGVGARTAAYQMWNHEFLSSEDDRDSLIEDYGRRETPLQACVNPG